jgi:hypothetical protein
MGTKLIAVATASAHFHIFINFRCSPVCVCRLYETHDVVARVKW